MRRSLMAIVFLGLLSAVALAVSAPAAAAAAGAGRLEVRALARTPSEAGVLYVLKGRGLRLEARSGALEPGETAVVEVRAGRRTTRVRARVRGSGGEGRVTIGFTPRQAGVHRVTARLEDDGSVSTSTSASTSASAPTLTGDRLLHAVEPRAGRGARGAGVRLLQRRLRALGFDVPLHGVFDDATDRAVLAFRKTNGMARTGYADGRVFSMLFRGAGGFRLRYPLAGKHVEFDWSRQVLVLADRGRPQFVYHVSSGAPATPTVFGTFRFYRKQPGVNALGMVHSNYFIRGYAIHGYASVPTFPASHGCIRVPIPNSGWVDRWIRLGEQVFSYH